MPAKPTEIKSLTHAERAARRKRIAEFCRSHSVHAAALEFGVTPSLIRAACAEAGVPCTRDADVKGAGRTIDVVAALLNSTVSYATIAERHRLTRQSVHGIAARCVEAGIKIRPRRGAA